MKGVNITAIEPAAQNDKGTTLEWRTDHGAGSQITIYRRHRQQDFGGHFHQGDDPSKNPEILFLLAGRLRLTVENTAGDREEFTIEENQQVVIEAGIAHWLQALTDQVTILEWRVTPFNREQPDTYPADQWPAYKASQQA